MILFSSYQFLVLAMEFKIIFSFLNVRDTRASVLEQSLRKLGVERLSKDDVQKMQWEVLEAKIGNWIHFVRIAVRACRKFHLLDIIFVTLTYLKPETGQAAVVSGKEDM